MYIVQVASNQVEDIIDCKKIRKNLLLLDILDCRKEERVLLMS